MLKSLAKRMINVPGGKLALRALETIAFGGKWLETISQNILRIHYRSRFRREWVWTDHAPHFFNHRMGVIDFCYGEHPVPYLYQRGFYVADLLHEGDKLLDIGCGDGFFTRRFFASRCSIIDAVDIESDAISAASRYNPSPKINYRKLDAVQEPFPSSNYDVVVWDGAMGHFSPDTTDSMVAKIRAALSDKGVFAGSESLGREGYDHLQFFESPADVDRLFSNHFRYRVYRVTEFEMPLNPGMVRREIYWRCANDPERIEGTTWKTA